MGRFSPIKTLRKVRFRFREFLFLVTLGSLIVAALAIRARTTRGLAAMDHAALAHQARSEADGWGRSIEELKRTLEWVSAIEEGREADLSVRSLSSLANREEMPANSSDRIVLAVVDDLVFLQLFDEQGRIVLNSYGIDDPRLKETLAGPPRVLTGTERERAMSIIATIFPYERNRLQLYLRGSEIRRAEALDKAQYHQSFLGGGP